MGRASKPDIIFLMTDQQRHDAMGVAGSGVKTPNLDRLATRGIRYSQAVCQAPMCIPSRNSMMFGLYPSQLGIRSNTSWGLTDGEMPVAPLPVRFQMAGYQTVGFGKTHWGKTRGPIGTRGFETRVVGAREVGLETGALHYQDDENPRGLAAYRRETADYGGGEEAVPGYIGCTSSVAERDHRDGWVAEKCLEFLEEGVDPNRPLFLYLSFLKPHAGFNVPKGYEDLYDLHEIPDMPQPPWTEESGTHLAWSDGAHPGFRGRYRAWREAWSAMSGEERRRTTLRYFANCTWLDHLFGRVLARLEALGRLENALVIFISDHGDMLGERNHRFSKYCLYDSSVRVPLILSGSGIAEGLRGTVDGRPAELVDVVPTLLAAAGIPDETALPGVDLLGSRRKEGSFCEFHDAGAPAYMWRTALHKLILYDRFDGEQGELYDLARDPHEWRNLYLIEEARPLREKMTRELLAHVAAAWHGHPKRNG